MNPALRSLVLSVAALGAACDDQAGDPVGPRGSEVTPTAPVLSVLTAPALLLDSHALYYCYHPGSTRNCVVLQRFPSITVPPQHPGVPSNVPVVAQADNS